MAKKNLGQYLALPMVIFMTLFFVIPILFIIVESFLPPSLTFNEPKTFGFAAYKALFQADYLNTLLNTLVISICSVAIALLLALPCAYYMVHSKRKTLLLFLIIIPFWTNFLVRIFAWKAILESNGFLNLILLKLHLITEPIIFLYNPVAVTIVLAYTYLPLMIFPLYSTIEKFDFALIDAARDLGCSHYQALYKILLPSIKTGITTALIFAFIPIFGQYVIPEIIGGGNRGTFMIGQRIANIFFRERNWAIPSAFATLLTASMLVGFSIYRLQIFVKKSLKKR